MRQQESDRPLTASGIFLFWFPLGLMWMMMAIEQPGLAAVIARLANAESNLAAFGVVFAIALVIESPIIQMLSSATALADCEHNYLMLLRLMHVLAIGLTAIHLVVGLTPVYDLIVTRVLNVPSTVADLARGPFIAMAPFSAAVGYRRLWQGTLIRHGKTWIVPVTMISRLGTVAVVMAIGYRSSRSGAMLAATALSIGVVVAAVAAGLLNRLMVLPALKNGQGDDRLSWRSLLRFFVPLSLTSMVFLLSQPLVTFGMTRSLQPTRSLAVFPVVNAFLFMFGSIGLSYQETAIALLGRNPDNRIGLRRFTLMLAVVVSGIMVLTAVTPLGAWWFGRVSGLSEPLRALTRTPTLILAVIPGLLTYKAWIRAQFVISGRTIVLTQAVIIYTGSLFAAVVLGAVYLPFIGVTIAALSLAIAQSFENGYLMLRRGRRNMLQRIPAEVGDGG